MLFRHRLLLLRSKGVDSPSRYFGTEASVAEGKERKEDSVLVCGSVASTLLHEHQWL